jgi:hypothetical protein
MTDVIRGNEGFELFVGDFGIDGHKISSGNTGLKSGHGFAARFA